MQSPDSKALRRGRHSESGRIYLLTFVTAMRARHFTEWESAAPVARGLASPAAWGDARLLCWVLMPNHWHGLMELGEYDLSRSVGKAKAHASRIWHGDLARRADLWMPGFHDHALREEEDIPSIARYIVANPIRAGLVRRIGDYPYWNAIWLDN